MSKLGTTMAFFAGVAVGGVTVWYAVKDRYAKLAEEEINSVKEAYYQRESTLNDAKSALERYSGNSEDETDPAVTPEVSKLMKKESVADYARRIKEGAPMDYSRTVVPPKTDIPEEPAKNAGEIPYVISPEEFDELDGYTLISLTYFADGVLSDEHGVIIDDVEEIIGDGLEHFGDYEDDSVYVRNDAKRCDYEILRDEREYAEFLKTLPKNI